MGGLSYRKIKLRNFDHTLSVQSKAYAWLRPIPTYTSSPPPSAPTLLCHSSLQACPLFFAGPTLCALRAPAAPRCSAGRSAGRSAGHSTGCAPAPFRAVSPAAGPAYLPAAVPDAVPDAVPAAVPDALPEALPSPGERTPQPSEPSTRTLQPTTRHPALRTPCGNRQPSRAAGPFTNSARNPHNPRRAVLLRKFRFEPVSPIPEPDFEARSIPPRKASCMRRQPPRPEANSGRKRRPETAAGSSGREQQRPEA